MWNFKSCDNLKHTKYLKSCIFEHHTLDFFKVKIGHIIICVKTTVKTMA